MSIQSARAVLSILDDDSLIDIHAAVIKKVKEGKLNAICRKLVASSGAGASSSYEFDCSLGELASALRQELNARPHLLPTVNIRTPQSRVGIRMGRCF